MSKVFFKNDNVSSVYHIYDTDNKRSLCGRFSIFGYDDTQCEEVTGKEVYLKYQDCKECFKKAKLMITID